jgi:hypothetical protein
MGDPILKRLSGHSLKFSWRSENHTVSPCDAYCECGEFAPTVSLKGARLWHRQHKADVLDSWVANGCDDKGREIHL